MPNVARVFAEEGLAAAERRGFTFVSAVWRGTLGSAIAHEGNPQKGLAMIRDGLNALKEMDAAGLVVSKNGLTISDRGALARRAILRSSH